MKTTKRILKSTITLFAMSAMLFLGVWWLSVQDATGASPNSNAQAALKFPRIPISITIGRASKKCAGFGICKITIGLKAAAHQRIVNAELSRDADGKLQLTLLEKAPEEGRTLFVDQDIPLSQEIAQKLGVKNATIQRGEYAYSASKSRLNARLTK